MGSFLILIVAVAATLAGADDSCPSKSEIAPCTCDGEGVNCMATPSLEQIRRAFKANFKYGGVRAIWIQGTSITSVPADLLNNIKTQQIYIEANNVSTVDMMAFNGSTRVLNSLSLFGNQLTSFNYSSIQNFDVLLTLNIGRNKITYIPSNAFTHHSLVALIMAENKISSIGMNAFSGLPKLQRLELSMNSLTQLGPMSFTTKSYYIQINLSNNQISDISSSAFTGTEPQAIILAGNQLKSLKYDVFGNLMMRMSQYGGILEVSANPLTCKGCDYSWIVNSKTVLLHMILGFQCPDGSSLQSLTKSSIGC